MIALKQIMVALDFTETVQVTIRYAADLSLLFNAEVVGCHVLEPPATLLPAVAGVDLLASNAREEIESLMRNASITRSRVLIEHGNPSSEIPRIARNEYIDLIVIGTHGRNSIADKLLGSTAEAVIRRAHCPVLVVREYKGNSNSTLPHNTSRKDL